MWSLGHQAKTAPKSAVWRRWVDGARLAPTTQKGEATVDLAALLLKSRVELVRDQVPLAGERQAGLWSESCLASGSIIGSCWLPRPETGSC